VLATIRASQPALTRYGVQDITLPCPMERKHSSWTCVRVEPKGDDGLGDARLLVVATLGAQHNQVTDITPDVIFVELGLPKTKGRPNAEQQERANVELLCFIAFLLGLQEEQVRMESDETERNKIVVLASVRHDKRELIWLLEAKVKQRHDAHFAVDKVNAARNLTCKQAVKRREELSEYRSLLEEAECANFAASIVPPALVSQQVTGKINLPNSLRVKRKTPEAAHEVVDASRQASRLARRSTSSCGLNVLPRPGVVSPSVADGAMAADTEGIGGLAAYDSEDESDSDENRPSLPPPAL